MKVLEARFHPRSKASGPYVRVAHVLRQGGRLVVQAISFRPEEVAPFEPTALLTRLNLLAGSRTPSAYEGLKDLPSSFWSFVEVDQPASSP